LLAGNIALTNETKRVNNKLEKWDQSPKVLDWVGQNLCTSNKSLVAGKKK